MKHSLSELATMDPKLILHPASSITALCENGPQMMISGKGCNVVDADGRTYLDAVAGLWCVNAGYGRRELSEAMASSAEQLGFYHTFSNASNPWQVALAERLIHHAPEAMGKVFFGSGGSDANDTLVKIAWHYHQLRGNVNKVKIIAREQAYHGTSISTASLTGLGGFHKAFPLPMDFVLRTDCPHFYTRGLANETEADFCSRLIQNIQKLIEREGANNIAAFIAEPIHAAGGIIEPPKDYYPQLGKLLRDNDILLIADEVVCGYGRLGSWFGCTELEIEPDMISTAKGLTSGYFPMSAAFISDPIWEVLKEGSAKLGNFSHGYTYSGHPVGSAVALANIEIIEREGLVEQSRKQGAYLHKKLNTVLSNHPLVGEIRGRGLLAGVQLVTDKSRGQLPDPKDKWAQQAAAKIRELGVIVRPLPSVATLAISPPLTISCEQLDTLVASIERSLDVLG